MTRAYIGVGSNLGDRHQNIVDAHAALQEKSNIRVVKTSKVYETDPVGGPPQGKYLNAVWEIDTALSAPELLTELQSIEEALGRKRLIKNEPRTMDLDILFYGREIYETTTLKIPHPEIEKRLFVLKPMAEIAPKYQHPLIRKTISRMLEDHDETVYKATPLTSSN